MPAIAGVRKRSARCHTEYSVRLCMTLCPSLHSAHFGPFDWLSSRVTTQEGTAFLASLHKRNPTRIHNAGPPSCPYTFCFSQTVSFFLSLPLPCFANSTRINLIHHDTETVRLVRGFCGTPMSNDFQENTAMFVSLA